MGLCRRSNLKQYWSKHPVFCSDFVPSSRKFGTLLSNSYFVDEQQSQQSGRSDKYLVCTHYGFSKFSLDHTFVEIVMGMIGCAKFVTS